MAEEMRASTKQYLLAEQEGLAWDQNPFE